MSNPIRGSKQICESKDGWKCYWKNLKGARGFPKTFFHHGNGDASTSFQSCHGHFSLFISEHPYYNRMFTKSGRHQR